MGDRCRRDDVELLVADHGGREGYFAIGMGEIGTAGLQYLIISKEVKSLYIVRLRKIKGSYVEVYMLSTRCVCVGTYVHVTGEDMISQIVFSYWVVVRSMGRFDRIYNMDKMGIDY